jgi:hypothetical protein
MGKKIGTRPNAALARPKELTAKTAGACTNNVPRGPKVKSRNVALSTKNVVRMRREVKP